MRVSIPTSGIDNTYEAFPEGAYEGQIASASLRDPNNDGSWLVLKIGIDSITAKEGTSETTRDRFSGDITIQTDGVNLFEVENFGNGKIPFTIKKAADLLAGLAEGLGVAGRDGGRVDVDLKEVAEALIDGQHEGDSVGFEVANWQPKAEGSSLRDQFASFGHSEV